MKIEGLLDLICEANIDRWMMMLEEIHQIFDVDDEFRWENQWAFGFDIREEEDELRREDEWAFYV